MDEQAFYGALVRGDVRCAIELLPPTHPLRERYAALLERREFPQNAADAWVNGVLSAYYAYYCDALYLQLPAQTAENALLLRLNALMQAQCADVEEAERALGERMAQRGLHFLGGRTGGYYGMYLWAQERLDEYDVELPCGVQRYAVRMLDGFVHKSWLDALSFGAVSTGGWAGDDGVICCVADSYDVDSEAFRVSLLRHEAQHVWDKAHSPRMTSAQLEYRAKLVELIYSTQRDLPGQFAREAGEEDGHALAAKWITEAFKARKEESVQAYARMLFDQDEEKRRKELC